MPVLGQAERVAARTESAVAEAAETVEVNGSSSVVAPVTSTSSGGFFTFGNNFLETPSGLRFSNLRNYVREGLQTGVQHLLRHSVDDVSRRVHSVFDKSGSALINQLDNAFAQAQAINWNTSLTTETVGNVTRVMRGVNANYIIETGARVGYKGGSSGTGNVLTKIRISVTPNNELITAFPE